MGAPDWSRRRSTPGGIDLRKRKFAFASQKFRLRRRCRSYFLVHFSFPISKFPRRRRPFLNFHTALLMIATGAHTQTKSTSGKKFAFASRNVSPSATVLSRSARRPQIRCSIRAKHIAPGIDRSPHYTFPTLPFPSRSWLSSCAEPQLLVGGGWSQTF